VANLEIACFIGNSGFFELDFLEREATPEPTMKIGIRLHLPGFRYSTPSAWIITIGHHLDIGCPLLSIDRSQLVQKVDLQPLDGADRITLLLTRP
jgi:putative transposase